MKNNFREIINNLKKSTNEQEILLKDELLKNKEFKNFLISLKKKVK